MTNETPKESGMARIRRIYSVPAKRGMKALSKRGANKNLVLTIRGSRHGWEVIAKDEHGSGGRYHPHDLIYAPNGVHRVNGEWVPK